MSGVMLGVVWCAAVAPYLGGCVAPRTGLDDAHPVSTLRRQVEPPAAALSR
jgi:hypothetical protein